MADYSMLFRKERASTGVKELDIAFEGGYPNPGTVAVIGPAGQEKLAFAFHFAAAGANKGENVIYVCLDMPPGEVETKAGAIGIALVPHTNKELFFIDAYSQAAGAKGAERSDAHVPGPAALNDLSLALNALLEKSGGKPMRMVLHSLSTLCLYSQPETVLKFLQMIDGRLKSANATCLWLVDDGLHDRKFISSVEAACDQVLRISDKGGAHELAVSGIPVMIPFRVGAAGIEIL